MHSHICLRRAFSETRQQTCFCCGILEKHKSFNEKGRNPIFHLLFDGAPARFLRNHLKNYARRILDQSFDITISSIVFNEIPFYIVTRCNNQSLRRWFTLINIFKTTLYARLSFNPCTKDPRIKDPKS